MNLAVGQAVILSCRIPRNSNFFPENLPLHTSQDGKKGAAATMAPIVIPTPEELDRRKVSTILPQTHNQKGSVR